MIKGYDAWLERPYQDAHADDEAIEEMEQELYEEYWKTSEKVEDALINFAYFIAEDQRSEKLNELLINALTAKDFERVGILVWNHVNEHITCESHDEAFEELERKREAEKEEAAIARYESRMGGY